MSNRFKLLCFQGLCLCNISQNNIIFNEDCNTQSITENWNVTGFFGNECTEYDSFDFEICHDYVCEIIDTDSTLTRIIPGKFDGVSLKFDFLNSNRIGSCIVEYSTDCGRNWNTIMERTSNKIDYVSTKNAFIAYDYAFSYEFRIRFRSNNADICAFDNIIFNGVSVNEKSTTASVTTMSPTNNPTLIPSIPPTSIARNTITSTVGTTIYNEPESKSVNDTEYQTSAISLKILVFIVVLISGFCLSCGICTIFIIWFIINGGFKENKKIIDNIKWIHHNNKHSEPTSIQNDTIVEIPQIISSPTFGDKPASINNEGSINDSCEPGDTITFNGDKHKKISESEGETGVDSAELCIPY